MILDLYIVRWDRMWHRVVKVCTIKWHMLLKMNDGGLALVIFLSRSYKKKKIAVWPRGTSLV